MPYRTVWGFGYNWRSFKLHTQLRLMGESKLSDYKRLSFEIFVSFPSSRILVVRSWLAIPHAHKLISAIIFSGSLSFPFSPSPTDAQDDYGNSLGVTNGKKIRKCE